MLRLTGWGKQGWTYGWDVEEDQGAWGICFQGTFCWDKSAWSLKHCFSIVCWLNCWIKRLAFMLGYPILKNTDVLSCRCVQTRRTGSSHTLPSWRSTSRWVLRIRRTILYSIHKNLNDTKNWGLLAIGHILGEAEHCWEKTRGGKYSLQLKWFAH